MFVPLLRFHFPEKTVEEMSSDVTPMKTTNPPVREIVDIMNLLLK